MSKAKFDAARELIAEGRYDEARSLLRTMDHPSAQKWLAKLDEIDPPFPNVSSKLSSADRINTVILRKLITIIRRGYLALAIVCLGGAVLLIPALLLSVNNPGVSSLLGAGLAVFATLGLLARWKYMNPQSIQAWLLKTDPDHARMQLRFGAIIPIIIGTSLLLLRPGSSLLFGWMFLPIGLVLMCFFAWQYWLIEQLEAMRQPGAPTVVRVTRLR